VQHAILAAFLVVQHELHGDSSATWPAGMGRVATVADDTNLREPLFPISSLFKGLSLLTAVLISLVVG
jgi:hypothetical protein